MRNIVEIENIALSEGVLKFIGQVNYIVKLNCFITIKEV